MSEYFLFNQELSTANRQLLECYISNKYGLGIGSCS
jgi:hypothetical protein